MDGYHYVYTLESLSNPSQIYTGQTHDLKQRLYFWQCEAR
jgi:predicted GIY-YIG superfamily endonuclease